MVFLEFLNVVLWFVVLVLLLKLRREGVKGR